MAWGRNHWFDHQQLSVDWWWHLDFRSVAARYGWIFFWNIIQVERKASQHSHRWLFPRSGPVYVCSSVSELLDENLRSEKKSVKGRKNVRKVKSFSKKRVCCLSVFLFLGGKHANFLGYQIYYESTLHLHPSTNLSWTVARLWHAWCGGFGGGDSWWWTWLA